MTRWRTALIWILLLFGFLMLVKVSSTSQTNQISWNQFLDLVETNAVVEARITENRIAVLTANGATVTTTVPPGDEQHHALLRAHKVKVIAEYSNSGEMLSWIFLALPLLLILLFIWGGRKNMGNIGGAATKFAQLGSQEVKAGEVKTTFDDVAGCDEAKADLMETVNYLKAPHLFEKLGGRVPKGVLLVGPPGTGKTLLARASAGEAGVAFFQISGSAFVEMFVGVGAARVRELFEYARKAAPCIVFIDEIDAVGRHRGSGLGQGNDEREQTLDQLLKELDGFKDRDKIVIIAATNRPDVLDPALMRPGRFDRHVVVPMPDLRAREAILRVHVRKITLSPDVDLSRVARALPPGMSGADVENLVNEAALNAVRGDKNAVEEVDLVMARDRVLIGPECRSTVLSDEEKRIVAFHEAGHTLVAFSIPESDPIHKVTIVPHAMALGLTWSLPERDRHIESKERILAHLAKAFGGRVAEELIFNSLSTGASNDFEQATKIARSMVMRWGMSELGERTFGSESEYTFLGQEFGSDRNYSEDTARRIDEEVTKILSAARDKAKKILSENLEKLHILAQALLERETVEGHELAALL